jgi:thiamine biosynthesis lipoprotein
MPDPGSLAGVNGRSSRPTRTRRDFLRSAAAVRQPAGDYWIRIARRAMACRFEITLASEDAAGVLAARAALNEVDRIEDALTVFRQTSVISRINRDAASDAVAVDESVFSLLRACAVLHEDTGGAFDITSTPLSRCWGFLQREGRLPEVNAIEAARALVGAEGILLDEATRTVRLDRLGLELNLGAIGKGYALDHVSETLRDAGLLHALLSAGRSSLLAIGGRARGWHVEVVSPRIDDRPLAQVWLRDAALGTSGAGEQFVMVDGARYGHVIDPRTGRPASGVLSASVIASSAATADALSTAFLVGGIELAERYCARHANVLALITLEGMDTPVAIGNHPGARTLSHVCEALA